MKFTLGSIVFGPPGGFLYSQAIRSIAGAPDSPRIKLHEKLDALLALYPHDRQAVIDEIAGVLDRLSDARCLQVQQRAGTGSPPVPSLAARLSDPSTFAQNSSPALSPETSRPPKKAKHTRKRGR